MVHQLTENYIPTELPHRDYQIKKINSIFDRLKKYHYGGNFLILGTTGSGKTLVIKHVISTNSNCLYTIAVQDNTATKIFKRMTGINTPNISTGDVVRELIKNLKQSPKVLIIDEVDKIKNFNNFINHLNEIYRETTVPIILITNKRTLIDDIPIDAKTTLILQKLEFPSYDAIQLKDIVISRLKLIKDLELPKVKEGALNYICAKAVKEGEHSARIALDLTLKCLLDNNFSDEFIDKIIYDMNQEDWNNFIHQLNETEKKFLEISIDLMSNKKEVTTPDIHEKMSYLSPARISQLATKFIEYGILKFEYKNLGRKSGRYRIINFSSEIVKHKLICLLFPWLDEEECKDETQKYCIQNQYI